MNFKHYQLLMDNMLSKNEKVCLDTDRLHPLVLAYIGDAYFSLYIRTKLLGFEQNKVRILHDYDAKMVSAVMQANAMRVIEPELSENELTIFKRGRNAKSTVPKSASVSEYRTSTGFEALLGYLYLKEDFCRLLEICDKAFCVISGKLTKNELEEKSES